MRVLTSRVVISLIAGLVGGAMLGSLQLSCGLVENAAGAISEDFAGIPPGPFPSSLAAFTAFGRRIRQASVGNVQFTYALCCPP